MNSNNSSLNQPFSPDLASSKQQRADLLRMQENIPAKLRAKARFCNWRYEARKGSKPAKVPYNPKTGQPARSNDPNTFGSFEEACEALRHNRGYDGIGVGIFGDLAAIDIDHCIENGEYSPMAEEIIERMDAYTETSPSGTGVRILFFAKTFSTTPTATISTTKSWGWRCTWRELLRSL